MLPISVARRVLRLLPRAQRREAFWLLPMMIIRAATETIGVASIMPFMAVVADPNGALENRYLQAVYSLLGFESTTAFIGFLGGASIATIVVSSALTVLATYQARRFAMQQRHRFQVQLMASYLSRPYSSFARVNTADLGESIITEVAEVVDGIISPLLLLVSRLVAVLAVLILLVAVNPYMAIITGTVLGGAYSLIFLAVQLRLRRLGRERNVVDRVRYRSISEAFSGIKAVKTSGREQLYLDNFSAATKRSADLSVAQHVINILPKSGLEAIAFGGVVGVVLYLMSASANTATALSIVTLYAFAFYRLLPATQQMYESFTQIRFSVPALDVLERSLAAVGDSAPTFDVAKPLGLQDRIELQNVEFSYPGAGTASLSNVSLQIERNSTVAFVGSTGSGKTTIIDLILGLYQPTGGRVCIDGVQLSSDRIRPWQATVGYVPQQVYLADASIAANIAFGETESTLDESAVHRAAIIAQIHSFVETLPDGYATHVGERGTRLSGGQLQRLGIARALYRDPDVLVFDEATNALDNLTESALFDALSTLAGQKTIVMVAHRLSTVKMCDAIYLVEGGRIAACGTFEKLLASSQAFRSLAATDVEPAVADPVL